MTDELWVCNLGLIEYREALDLQKRVRDARVAGLVPDVLLQLEHPRVYTRGRRAGADELPFAEEFYAEQGIEIITTDRGGKITYHGPGQLVGYPILRVSDVVAYVRLLERAIIAALAEEGLSARDRAAEGPDYTGVWLEQRKIASIGVHVARGVTTHGFAVNVDNELTPFDWVVACGLPDVQMTSLAAEHEAVSEPCRESAMSCFRKRMSFALASELGLRQRLVTLRALESRLPRVKPSVRLTGVR
jgi:lipoyl(octanoyl) transferase